MGGDGHHPAVLRVRAEVLTATAVSGWTYTTVIADAPSRLATRGNRESEELRWVHEDEVVALPLHPAFAASWPRLRATPVQVGLDADELPRTVDRGNEGFAWLYA